MKPMVVKSRVRKGQREFTIVPDNGSRPTWPQPGQYGWFATREDAQAEAERRNAYEGRA